jgi:hypothetical protein
MPESGAIRTTIVDRQRRQEFLHRQWVLIQEIAALTDRMKLRVESILDDSMWRYAVPVTRPAWYY